MRRTLLTATFAGLCLFGWAARDARACPCDKDKAKGTPECTKGAKCEKGHSCPHEHECQKAKGAARAAKPKAVPKDAATVALTIDGMHCDDCALRISSELEKMDGVYVASVDFAKKRAEVQYSAAKIKVPQLIEAVQKLGFKAMPAVASTPTKG